MSLPCRNKYCPISPPPDLSLIPDDKVIKLPPQEIPKKKAAPYSNRGLITNHVPYDSDCYSSGWSIIVALYEGE